MKATRPRPVAWDFLLGFTLVTVALPTVITYRGLFQPRYEWGLFGLKGVGAGAPWWLIALAAAGGWLILGLGYRRPGRLAAGVLCLWHGALLANVLGHVLKGGATMTLRGDAIGMSVPLSLLGPLFTAVLFATSAFHLYRFWRIEPPSPDSPTGPAKGMLATGLLLTVVIALLFLQGDGARHGVLDRLAILGVVLQCLLIGGGLQSSRLEEPLAGDVRGPTSSRSSAADLVE